jgi:hypothetical protein
MILLCADPVVVVVVAMMVIIAALVVAVMIFRPFALEPIDFAISFDPSDV